MLLGASGSGKSTVLRMIAGLLNPDGGRIFLEGDEVTGWVPQKRRVGFVFQNYSIFQHMSVAENIEFGMKIRKMTVLERARRRDQLLQLVGLAELHDLARSVFLSPQQSPITREHQYNCFSDLNKWLLPLRNQQQTCLQLAVVQLLRRVFQLPFAESGCACLACPTLASFLLFFPLESKTCWSTQSCRQTRCHQAASLG